MLTIKTGMADETKIAKAHCAPDVLVLSGIQTVESLDKLVPKECTGIISFGLCGGLAPEPRIGQIFLGDVLITPEGNFYPDYKWGTRFLAKTGATESHWYSSGQFNEGDTPDQRIALFKRTGAAVIDDESFHVAKFAKARGIPFQMLRSVSDVANDNVPPAARNALNSDGSTNVMAVLESVLGDLSQIPELIRLGQQYYKSLGTLTSAAIQIGPEFQLI